MSEIDTDNHQWRAPTGALIEGTLERIPGTAYVSFDGANAWHNGGGTEVYWDGQTTVCRAGETVWCDEDGEQWLESQVIKDPDADLPPTIDSPWDDRAKLEALLREHLDDFYRLILDDRARGSISSEEQFFADDAISQLLDKAVIPMRTRLGPEPR